MAVVKICEPKKSKVGLYNLLQYLLNDHEEKIYATASNLSTNPNVAFHIINQLNNYTGERNVKIHAQHIVQSFSPKDNVTPEKANEMAHELMERLGYKQYAYTVVTHYDKDHVHNHIVFSPTSLLTHKQYQSNKPELNRIRNISDDICRESKQSVIENKEVGYKNPYMNWTQWQRIHSAKKDIKRAIDKAIQYTDSYEQLLLRLQSWGYEVDKQDGKLFIKHPRLKHAIKVSRIGAGYTKKDLEQRILEIGRIKKATKQLLTLSSYRSERGRNLAAIENIKIMSQALHFMKRNHLDSVYDFTIRESELNDLKEKMIAKMNVIEQSVNQYQDYFTDVEVVESNSALLKEYLASSPEKQQELLQKYNMEQMLKRLERGHNFYLENKVTVYEGVQRQCDLMEKMQILKEDMQELNTQIDVLKNARDVLLQKNILPKPTPVLERHSVSSEQRNKREPLDDFALKRMKEFEELKKWFARIDQEYKDLEQPREQSAPRRNDDWER